MNKRVSRIIFLAPMCLTIFACTKQNNQEQEKGFDNMVATNLEEGTDFVHHDLNSKNKWEYDEAMWYVNNLDKVPLPDPQVYAEDGTYYIVGTDDKTSCKKITCYYTTDFVTYTSKVIYTPANGCWEKQSDPTIYAPEMHKVGDKYYLYYSAIEDSTNKRRNSVVWADTPLGPYQPIVNTEVDGLHNALFKNDETSSVLDSTLFIDDDNQMYMYYSWHNNETGQSVWGVKLNSPYQADWTTRKLIVRCGKLTNESTEDVLEWEYAYRDSHRPIAEGPYMLKSNGKYYMTYSINGCWNKYYDVCYAVSDNPLGLFEKPYKEGQYYSNLLMGVPCSNKEGDVVFEQWSGFASGTGHHCFFKIGDQIMIGYHAHQNRNFNSSSSGWVARYFAMDPVYFLEDGTPFVNGPSWSPQPLPEAMSGYGNIAPKATVRVQNVTNEKAINDRYVVDCYNLEHEQGKEVELGKGFSFIELKFDKEYSVKGLMVNNSADYFKMVYDINYVQFSSGDAFKYSQFSNACVNYDAEFVFPCGAFTYQFNEEIRASSVIISFNSSEPLAINEIQVLAR